MKQMRAKYRVVVVVLMLVAVLFGCQCGTGKKGPGGGDKAPGGEAELDPADKQGAEAVKKVGDVSVEGGRIVAVNLFKPGTNDDTLKDVGSLTKVRKVQISQAKVSPAGLKHFASLPELVDLNLYGAGIDDAGLKELAKLTQLKTLKLQGFAGTGTGLQALAPLTKLEEFSVANTSNMGNAAGISIATSLKGLKNLYIDNSDLEDAGLAAIADMPDLRLLSIHGNFKLTAKGFNTLPRAKKLEELHLGFTFKDDSAKAIGQCSSLKVLRLFHCEITDKGFRELMKLELKELEVRSGSIMNVSGAVVDEYKKAHPNCKVEQR